ncbi:MAG: hypothetical protein ABI435_02845 [Pseudolysinimonas sp.]
MIVVGSPALGAALVDGGAFRSTLELYGRITTTPLILVFPILAVALGCGRLFAEVSHRFIVNVRVRTDLIPYIGTKVVASGMAAFAPFFALAAVPFVLIVALGYVPGTTIVSPEIYELTAAEAQAAAGSYATFTQLYAVAPPLFGLVYSIWVGLNAALCAALGSLSLFAIPNRFVALLVPFATYFGESLVVSLLGHPEYGLVYLVFPFGLAQGSLVTPLIALVLLSSGVLLLGRFGLGGVQALERLT